MNFKFYKNLSFFNKAIIAFLLVFSFNSSQAQTGNGITGYTYLGSYNNHYYYISTSTVFGDQIASHLQANAPAGGYVATLNSAAENSAVLAMVIAAKGISPVGGYDQPQNPWIGFSDAIVEGTFIWTNGEPVCYTNWNEGEPNNFVNDEDYTQLLSWNGKWNDWFNNINPGGKEFPLPYLLEYGQKITTCTPPTLSVIKEDIKCFGKNDGTITLTVSGGTSPYSFNLYGMTPSTGTFTAATTTITNLAPGPYSVTVTDASGIITESSTFTIMESVSQLAASVTPTDPTCPAGNDGLVTIVPSGGTSPYSITVNGGSSTSLPSTGQTFSGLSAGNYNYIITDKNQCVISKQITFLACPPDLNCRVTNGDFSSGTALSDLHFGLPRNGSYQVVSNVSQLGGGGYLNISSSGKFLAAHTSNKSTDRIVYTNLTSLEPGKKYEFCVRVTLLKNLGSGANFQLALYAGNNKIGSGRVTFDWTTICGTFTAPANGPIELSVRDDKKGLFFVALDDLCVTPLVAARLNNTTTTIAEPMSITTTPAVVAPTVALIQEKLSEPVLDKLMVTVQPNPSKSQFTIQLQSKDQASIKIRIMDASGRIVKNFNNLPSNHTFSFGSDLKKGTYFAEMIQGSERKIIKLIKL